MDASKMNAYEIAHAGTPEVPHYLKNKVTPEMAIWNFINFVQFTGDKDIRGLVKIMTEELQRRRQDGKEYLGGNSTDWTKCFKDSEYLLARALLDRSSHGHPNLCYVKRQIDNISWKNDRIMGGEVDCFKSWVDAQREYVSIQLNYLEEIQKASSEAVV